jgi:hypothetical protein
MDDLHNTTLDWRALAADEISLRKRALFEERSTIPGEIERLGERASAIGTELSELDAAARVLNLLPRSPDAAVVVEPVFETLADRQFNQGSPPRIAKHRVMPAVRFKKFALEVLRARYPNPVRAAELSKLAQAELGRAFHEKTAGMTLYRLSVDGTASRDGHDWFFVPATEAQSAEQDNPDGEPSGLDPGISSAGVGAPVAPTGLWPEPGRQGGTRKISTSTVCT